MTSPAGSVASPTETVLRVGQVSAVLGIPAVTLRTWEARYGLRPSGRTSGKHRRYTDLDIARLRRMRDLIDSGVSAGDAARISAAEQPADDFGSPHAGVQFLDAVESLDTPRVTGLLDSALAQQGTRWTWSELIVPTFRRLETRFASLGDCTDIELILAQSVEAAVERHLDRRRLRSDAPRPVLLAHCPDERHTLPLTILRAVLIEQGHSAITLGPGTTPTAILEAIERLRPSTVVLWSVVRRPGQLPLHNRVTATGTTTLTAGPGWPSSRNPLTSLEQATKVLSARRRPRKL